MPTYYVDFENGDDQNDGSTFSLAGYSIPADAVPTMTDYTAPSGVASADSELSATQQAWKAFSDKNYDQTTDCWVSTNTAYPHWVKYQFPTGKVIVAYSICATGSLTPRYFTAWKFQGSNNDVDWTDLDSRTGQTFVAQRPNYYSFSNSTSYTYYRVYASAGNNSNYGYMGELQMFESTPALVGPWKSITYGSTADRTVPGDTIKIAKSPDSVSPAGVTVTTTAGAYNVNAQLSEPLTADICNCDSLWTGVTNCTATLNTLYELEGTGCCQLATLAAFTSGKMGYFDLGEAKDFSAYEKVSFTLSTGVDIGPGALTLCLCSDTTGDTPVNSFLITDLLGYDTVSKGMHYFTIDNGGPLGNNIRSVALYANYDFGAATIRIDNILACNDFSLNSLIDNGHGGYTAVVSIRNGVDLWLGNYVYQYYWPFASDTFDLTYINPVHCPTHVPIGSNSYVNTANESGTSGNVITYTGGWDTGTGLQDGMTWVDCISNLGYGFYTTGKSYIKIANMGFARANYGIYCASSGSYLEFENIETASMYNGSIYLAEGLTTGIVFNGTFKFTAGMMNNSDIYIPATSYGLVSNADIYSWRGTMGVAIVIKGRNHKFYGKIEGFGGDPFVSFASCEDTYVKRVNFRSLVYSDFLAFNAGTFNIVIDEFDTDQAQIIYGIHMDATGTGNRINRFIGIDYVYNPFTYMFYYSGASTTSNRNGGVDISILDYANRWFSGRAGGTISDQITAGLTEAWAYNGTGTCVYLNPTHTSIYLPYKFYLPVVASTTYQLHMQVKKTSAAATCTLKAARIFGCGITQIYDEDITLTDSWAEYTSTSFTPTHAGYIEVELHALNGSTTGDIGIDNIHLATV